MSDATASGQGRPVWPLRRKLVLACLLVQLVAGGALVFASTRLLQRTLIDQAQVQTRQVLDLLEQAIATPMAQRDYATLQQTLDLVRQGNTIAYLVLWDHRGKSMAASGWDESRPLPPRDTGTPDLDRADKTLHLSAPIRMAGQALGRVDLGLATDQLREARRDFLQRSLAIAAGALVASLLVLGTIALAVTRHLAGLAQATRRVAQGDFDVQVPVTTGDEIGTLANSFNAMALALKERVAALEHSEMQQKLHLQAAREEQSRLTTLLGAMPGGIVFVDGEGHVLYANAAFARLWSIPDIAPGHMLADVVPSLRHQVEPADAPLIDAMGQPLGAGMGHRELRTRDGRIVVQRMQPIARGTLSGGCIWFHDDVTRDRRTQQRAQQALHDALTALLNRRGLEEALQSALPLAEADGLPVSLLFIDLDDFKQANDTGGHRTGDDILVAVARTLSAQMRKGDTVARLGGDEFAVLCPGMDTADASALAARLVESVAGLRFAVADQAPLRVGCSIGVATFPADARSDGDLLACADAAMYEAKRGGKNSWSTFQAASPRVGSDYPRSDWTPRIRQALAEQRLVLHFQPVLRASDLRISHHEALLRMLDADDPRRLIPPSDFVPQAERSGAIRLVDRWVFEACITHLAGADAGVRIAAKLSARSLADPEFAPHLRGLLQRHDVDPRRLLVEVRDSATLGDPATARQRIEDLRRLGCAVQLDDFGNGFNSLSQLPLIDVDAVKIDGAVIRGMLSDAGHRLWVAALIEIAHSRNKLAVAEHVEDAETLDLLRSLGIDLVQGFHLGRPGERLADGRSRPQLHVVSEFRRSTRGDAG